uniref:SET domain-containing protein n=1 Tax=Hyaloperonospora arabidopsidis (strain Emoy2) TaxID=559515 RepID=M4B8Z9_HYAAE
MGCLNDCLNRAVSTGKSSLHALLDEIVVKLVLMEALDACEYQALVECIPGFCKNGDLCDNMRIQRGVMPSMQLMECGNNKGLGLKLLEDIKAGSFVSEYMGEIVTEQEYYMRRVLYHNEKHRYMMVLSGGEVIDATRMGGWARFINHSCDPNCGVEKWDVNGEERCAIFALRDIVAGEELTFDYKFESFSKAVIGRNNRATRMYKSHSNKADAAAAPALRGSKLLDPVIGLKARAVQGAKVGRAFIVVVLLFQDVYTTAFAVHRDIESRSSNAANGTAASPEQRRRSRAASIERDARA